jgi:hypothetical protein
MPGIEIKNINQGGIADSDYLGLANSVSEMVGLDIHSTPGLIKVNQKLTKESGSTIDDFIKTGVACSDGKTYLFGSTTGRIWSRDSGGVYTLEATVAPASGIVGSKEYEGYIYYAMETKLGRWQIGTSWATRDDNWATFTNGDIDFHPMRVLNLVLYIGDGNLIAQVDNSTGTAVFSANALDIYSQYRIKCLGQLNTDLLIGTIISSNVIDTQIFRWNTWSVSFTSSDPIPEVGINAFLETDNYVIVSAGTKGKLYLYNGSQLEDYQQLPGTWGSTNKATVHPNAVFNFGGLPLFGVSRQTGTPTNLGIYSIGRANRKYPFVLNMDYPISLDRFINLEIGCIIGVGDIFLVSWKDNQNGDFGVDKLDLTLKYSGAYLISRAIITDRMQSTVYGSAYAGYRQLPSGTSITLQKSVNYEAFEDIGEHKTDTTKKIVYTDVDITDCTVLKLKTIFGANGDDAPEVDVIRIDERLNQ